MTFKFVSLKIWLGGKMIDKLTDFLAAEKADIIALQEADNQMLDILKKKLDMHHAIFAPAFEMIYDGKNVQSGNAILSLFPIIASEVIFYDNQYEFIDLQKIDYAHVPRNLQHATVSIGEKIIHVFNTQGMWGRDDNDNPRRLQMADTILKRIQSKPNVVLVGDLNVDQDSETIKIIEKELKNVFKHELQTSFNPKHKRNGSFHDSVVDFIFASPSLKVIDHYCPTVDVSDHLPLVSVFEIS